MRPEIKVSISAKLEHAPKLMKSIPDGFHGNSRWIPLEVAGATNRNQPVTHWQQANFDDIAMAHFHMLYLEPGDHIKGAAWETGWAAGRGKRIWIAGDGHGVEMPLPGGTVIPIKKQKSKKKIEDGPMMCVPHRDIFPWARYRQQVRIVLSIEQAFTEMKAIVDAMYNVNSDGGLVPPPNFFEL